MPSRAGARLSKSAEAILVSAYRAKFRYGKVYWHVGPMSDPVVAVGRLRGEGAKWVRALAELERKKYVRRATTTRYELTACGAARAAASVRVWEASAGESRLRSSDRR